MCFKFTNVNAQYQKTKLFKAVFEMSVDVKPDHLFSSRVLNLRKLSKFDSGGNQEEIEFW
jgi:hypothetical protein